MADGMRGKSVLRAFAAMDPQTNAILHQRDEARLASERDRKAMLSKVIIEGLQTGAINQQEGARALQQLGYGELITSSNAPPQSLEQYGGGPPREKTMETIIDKAPRKAKRVNAFIDGKEVPAILDDFGNLTSPSGEKLPTALLKDPDGRGGYTTLVDTVIDGKIYKVPFDHRAGTYRWDQKLLTSPKDPSVQRDIAYSKNSGKVEGEQRTTAQIDLPKVKSDANYLIDVVNQAIKHPGMSGAVGMWGLGKVKSYVPGTEEKNFMTYHKQIAGKQFMQAYQSLRGGGQITEKEGEKATEALSRMNTAASEKEYINAANDFIREINRFSQIAENRASGRPINNAPSAGGWSIEPL